MNPNCMEIEPCDANISENQGTTNTLKNTLMKKTGRLKQYLLVLPSTVKEYFTKFELILDRIDSCKTRKNSP